MHGNLSGMVPGMSLRVDLLDFHLGARLTLTDADGRASWSTVCPQVWTGGLLPSNHHQSSRHCTSPRPFQLVPAPASFNGSPCSAAHGPLDVSVGRNSQRRQPQIRGPESVEDTGPLPAHELLLLFRRIHLGLLFFSPNYPPTREDPLCQEFLTHLPISACQRPTSSQILQLLSARGSSHSPSLLGPTFRIISSPLISPPLHTLCSLCDSDNCPPPPKPISEVSLPKKATWNFQKL